jgi:hypothetical protein
MQRKVQIIASPERQYIIYDDDRTYDLADNGIVFEGKIEVLLEEDYSKVYQVTCEGLHPGIFNALWLRLVEHLTVIRHFLPPTPSPVDIEKLFDPPKK